MGGRVATLFASERLSNDVHGPGVIVRRLSFPSTQTTRQNPFAAFSRYSLPGADSPGERDPFGNVDEVSGYSLPNNISVAWLADGDHDFKPRRVSGLNQQVLIDEAAILAASFVRAHQARYV